MLCAVQMSQCQYWPEENYIVTKQKAWPQTSCKEATRKPIIRHNNSIVPRSKAEIEIISFSPSHKSKYLLMFINYAVNLLSSLIREMLVYSVFPLLIKLLLPIKELIKIAGFYFLALISLSSLCNLISSIRLCCVGITAKCWRIFIVYLINVYFPLLVLLDSDAVIQKSGPKTSNLNCFLSLLYCCECVIGLLININVQRSVIRKRKEKLLRQ